MKKLHTFLYVFFKHYDLYHQVFHQPVSGCPRWITRLSRRSSCVSALSRRTDQDPGPRLYTENELQWSVIVYISLQSSLLPLWFGLLFKPLSRTRNGSCSRPWSSSAGGNISVSYSGGDDVCGNGMKAKTEIRLSCGSTVGHPLLLR